MPANCVKRAGENRLYVFDFGDQIELAANGDTLSGVPTVTFTPSGLTVSAATVVNAPPTTQGGSGVANGAAQVRISGGTSGTTYSGTCTSTTTQGNTLVALGTLQVT